MANPPRNRNPDLPTTFYKCRHYELNPSPFVRGPPNPQPNQSATDPVGDVCMIASMKIEGRVVLELFH